MELTQISTQNQTTNNERADASLVNQFGTAFYPRRFRLAVKVISYEGSYLHCQGLKSLEHFQVSKEHFYPWEHPFNPVSIEQQIKDYNQIPAQVRQEAYNLSQIHLFAP